MKISVTPITVAVAALCLAGVESVQAYPGPRDEFHLATRETLPIDAQLIALREFADHGDDISARGFKDLVKSVQKLKSTPAQKEKRKQKTAARKEYRKNGKNIAAEAKKDAKAGGHAYDVSIKFNAPGFKQYEGKAKELVKKGWHSHKNLQQFRQADVTISTLKSGRKMVNARYNNGAITGVHVQYMFD